MKEKLTIQYNLSINTNFKQFIWIFALQKNYINWVSNWRAVKFWQDYKCTLWNLFLFTIFYLFYLPLKIHAPPLYWTTPWEAVVSLNSLFLWLLMEIGHWNFWKEIGDREERQGTPFHPVYLTYLHWRSCQVALSTQRPFQVSVSASLPCPYSLSVVIDSHCCLHWGAILSLIGVS